jgi:rfaE bifunctional protein nucleotidyltransferase chain/domain
MALQDAPVFDSLTELVRHVEDYRHGGKLIAFVNGCFDTFLAGHVRLFKYAKQMAAYLIVGVNSDESIRVLKGQDRPKYPLNRRVEVVSSIRYVDCVLIGSFEERWVEEIAAIAPNFWIKGSDYSPSTIDADEMAAAVRCGTELAIMPVGWGTTSVAPRGDFV